MRFIFAGEASGDKLDAAMMAGLKSFATPEFHGVGGPVTQAQDLERLSLSLNRQGLPKLCFV